MTKHHPPLHAQQRVISFSSSILILPCLFQHQNFHHKISPKNFQSSIQTKKSSIFSFFENCSQMAVMFNGGRGLLLKLSSPLKSPSVLKPKHILFPLKSKQSFCKAAYVEDDRDRKIREKPAEAADRAKEALKEGSESGKEKANTVKEKAQDAANNTSAWAKDTANSVSDKARNLGDDTKESAKEAKEKTEENAESVVDKTKEGFGKVADVAGNVAEKAKEAGKGVAEAANDTTKKIRDTVVGKDDNN